MKTEPRQWQKYIDTPDHQNTAYENLMENVEAGRTVVIVPLVNEDTYSYSCEFPFATDDQDLSLWRCVKAAISGHNAAEADGHRPTVET